MAMDLVLVASIPVLLAILWMYMAFMAGAFPTITGKRILLLIAHPDDEAMFFAPTVQALIRPELGNQLKILCLSSGNADGLGDVRKKELLKSASVLGLQTADVIVVDDANLQDGFTPWNSQYISRILLSNLTPSLSKTPSSKPPTALIDTIITFDEQGVSQHPNHVSCYRGAETFLSELMKGRDGWESPVSIYVLKSVGRVRKYTHICDSLVTICACALRVAGERRRKAKIRAKSGRVGDQRLSSGISPMTLLFVNGVVAWTTAQRAMVFGHWSQMVWFRWGWIGFGRYLLINDLVKVKVS